MSDAIRTFTGRLFYPLAPGALGISILDIAHALSHLCRFGGHTRVFYSVAEHSVRCAERLELAAGPDDAHLLLWALLHDASEAYLCDLPRPLKHAPGFGETYRRSEAHLMAAVCRRFLLDREEPELVRQVDDLLLGAELRDLMQQSVVSVLPTIVPWTSAEAKERFLAAFRRLAPNDPEAR